MRKLLGIFALLMAASMLFWMVGCGEDEEEEEAGPAPKVSSVTPAGGDISSNATVTVVFSKKVASATIALNGVPVAATSADNKTWTFQPGEASVGTGVSLTIDAEDDAGQGLDPAFTPLTFNISPPDTTPPDIVDANCDPKNNATGVDPSGYEGVKVAFTEAMDATTTVTAIEPEISPAPTWEVTDGGKVLQGSFLGGFKMSNEQTYTFTLSGKDLAGNPLARTTYEFTTMAKEE